MNELITKEEMEKIRKGISQIDEIIHPRMPILLKSGYIVGLSTEIYPKIGRIEHLSISSYIKDADPADIEWITLEILGKDFVNIGEIFVKNNFHFLKSLEGKNEILRNIIKEGRIFE